MIRLFVASITALIFITLAGNASAQSSGAEYCNARESLNVGAWRGESPLNVKHGKNFFQCMRDVAGSFDAKNLDDLLPEDLSYCSFSLVQETVVQDGGFMGYGHYFDTTVGDCYGSNGPYQVRYGARTGKTNGFGYDGSMRLLACISFAGRTPLSAGWGSFDNFGMDFSTDLDCRSSDAVERIVRAEQASWSSPSSYSSSSTVYTPSCVTVYDWCGSSGTQQCPFTVCDGVRQ